ncbi:MAG: glucuronosyltransferase [Phycisphaerae bacterium]
MKRVVLFTLHYWGSRRRAGFHWLADAWHGLGWDVTFVTIYLSRLTALRGQDYRLQYPVLNEANRPVEVRPRLRSYVWLTAFHPLNLRIDWLNRLTSPLMKLYARLPLGPLAELIGQADLLLYESHAGLMLYDRFARLAPKARTVYRVSDSLDLLKTHPAIATAEQAAAPRFNRISCPCRALCERFAGLPAATVDHHGIDPAPFEAPCPDPYPDTGRGRAVFVGTSHVDVDFLARAARLCPQIDFHAIGPVENLPLADNLVAHGTLPFAATVPYLKHADVGLACRSWTPGAETLTDSLKIIQYTWCRLPVVVPRFLDSARANVIPYDVGDDDSIARAMHEALAMDPARVDTSDVQTWTQLARTLAGEETP